MNHSRVTQALALTVIGLALTACAGAAPTAPPAAPQKTVTMKFVAALPEQSPVIQAALRYFKDVEERTQKTSTAVKFEYFLASQLYNANQIPRAIADGAVEVGQAYAATIADQMAPATAIINAPLIWDDEDHVRRAVDGELGQILASEMEKNNLKVLWFNQNFSYELWGRDKPFIKPGDAKGLRLRSLGGIYDEFYQAVGGASVNVPTAEQYSAFQRGIVDGMLQTPESVQSRKTYEVMKYATKGGKLAATADFVLINLDTWKSLPKDTQDVFSSTAKEAGGREAERVKQQYNEIMSDIESKGMQMIQMSDADRTAWFAYRKAIEDAYIKGTGDIGRKTLDAVEKSRKK